jgi:hypothetical protein
MAPPHVITQLLEIILDVAAVCGVFLQTEKRRDFLWGRGRGGSCTGAAAQLQQVVRSDEGVLPLHVLDCAFVL